MQAVQQAIASITTGAAILMEPEVEKGLTAEQAFARRISKELGDGLHFLAIVEPQTGNLLHVQGETPAQMENILRLVLHLFRLHNANEKPEADNDLKQRFEAHLQFGEPYAFAYQLATDLIAVALSESSLVAQGYLRTIFQKSISRFPSLGQAPATADATQKDSQLGKAIAKKGAKSGPDSHQFAMPAVDSMQAAMRTQQELLGDLKLLRRFIPEHLLIYMPKEHVSGDFYWFRAFDKKIVIVLADCTGHSLEGALMTVMGASLLRMMVTRENCMKPDAILDLMNEQIVETGHEGTVKTLGMEMGILSIDTETKDIRFAGARTNLVAQMGTEQTIYKADRFSLGSQDVGVPFTQHTIAYQKGLQFYFFTDGVQDQFGGDTKKKLGKGSLLSKLKEISGHSMEDQYLELQQYLYSWQGEIEQTDDITLLGLKLP